MLKVLLGIAALVGIGLAVKGGKKKPTAVTVTPRPAPVPPVPGPVVATDVKPLPKDKDAAIQKVIGLLKAKGLTFKSVVVEEDGIHVHAGDEQADPGYQTLPREVDGLAVMVEE